MRAEIIVVGSELANGSKLDTNGQWLSLELAAVGIPVFMHTTIRDELEEMVELFRRAIERSDFVFITGGLGPTLDDLTRQALAGATGAPLERHEPSLQHIQALFAARNRVMPDRNVIQAMIPRGSEAIPNPRGTAPGLWMKVERPAGTPCHVVALPGVPTEMKPMFRESVLPRLPRGRRFIRLYRVNVFGMGESAVEERLGDLTARGKVPEVGITAHEATITLRITAIGESVAACDQQADQVRAVIYKRLGELVYGEDDEQLEDVVVRMLRERGETLAVVETPLSGGRLTEWLSAVPGVSDVFRGGITAVSLDMGLPPADVIPDPNSEDGKPARMLAEAYRTTFRATWGLAIAGQAAANGKNPSGTIAVVGSDCVTTVPYHSFGDPAIDRSRATKTALDLLRRRLSRT